MVGAAEARKKLSTIVERVRHQGDSYVISRYGKPVAAVVPLEAHEDWQHHREESFDLTTALQ
jgi:prevent-host-death family protein